MRARPLAVAVLAAGLALAGGAQARSDDAILAPAGAAGAPADSALSVVAQARAYEHGEGVPKDPLHAAALYCEAARFGDAEALYSLGWMYANGRGVPRDDATAAAFFERAALRGHGPAQRALELVTATPGPLPDCMAPPQVSESPLPGLDLPAEPDPFDMLAPWKQAIAKVVAELAPKYAIEPRLALAIITVESNFVATAQSAKDARGLMQLIPETAARFNVRDAFDVRQNLRGGLAYLRYLLAYYRGQVPLAAAAYNAGENAVDRYRGIPPYAETVDYVRRVRALFGRDTHPFDPAVGKTSPILDTPPAGPPGGTVQGQLSSRR